MSEPSLKRNAFALLAMQAIKYLVPLITLPYLTRTLGAEQYGAFNVALSLTQYGVLFINFGFNLSATQYIARHRHQPLLISRSFWETMMAKMGLFVIACVLLTLITLNIESFYVIRWLVFILFLQLLSVALDPLWFFQGIEKLEKISLIGSAVRLLNIPLLILFVRSPNDVEIAALIQSGLLLMTALINMMLVKKEQMIFVIKYSQLKIKHALKQSLPLFIGAAAISLYNTSTPIILGLVSNYDEVGIYSASFQVQMAAIGVFSVLGQVIYPRVNHLFAKNPESGYRFVKKLLIYMFPVMLVSTIIFYFTVPIIAPWLLGEQFKASQITLEIMAPMLFLTPYCIVFANNLLLPLGHQRIYYLVPLVLGILHVMYTVVFSHYFGAIGASGAILLTELLTFCVLGICVLKLTQLKKYWNNIK
ncbi:flippase [Wohlfahrtiimonas chitiniclastica]|uniref:flippase n=1 Tax=Wohlfahrtiimonas chitiniclastica TaxID=400946 RepID=UPI0007B697B3|nr:flippase [Wohlfahrtiimonas chitiniclastica]KZX36397.1 hypothetical protein A6V30_08375 [Wohlfahrtiimonas chitiniclastica]